MADQRKEIINLCELGVLCGKKVPLKVVNLKPDKETKMRNKIEKMFRLFLLLALAILFCPGCLIMQNKKEYLRRDESVKRVEFESEEAGRLFHKQRKRNRCRTQAGNESLVIPFIIVYNKQTELSSNARYNNEIDKCDSNGNGMITLEEARIYSGESEKKHSGGSPCSPCSHQ